MCVCVCICMYIMYFCTCACHVTVRGQLSGSGFSFIVGSGGPAVIVRIIPKDGKMLFREMDRVGCVASVFPAEPPAGHSWIFDF